MTTISAPLIALLCALALCGGHVAHAEVLDEIRTRGTVRIATTADYRPFSFMDAGKAVGIDIELGRALAAALGVEVDWIPTSWPTLLDDLTANRFDIAMSGISITTERASHGAFSRPYFHTGKTILVRCALNQRVQTLADVDRADLRVIVNPGGSNHRFVVDHIHHARIIVHPDNVTVFDALARGEADVMITDAVEAQLESTRNTDLCTTPSPPYLAAVDKAFLMPADPIWQAYVDVWLGQMFEQRAVAAILNRYLPDQPSKGRW